MSSGYTHCACRDCFETVVSDEESRPDFCDDCETAGCEPDSECQALDTWSEPEDWSPPNAETTEVTEAVVMLTLREVADLLNMLTPVRAQLDLLIEVGPVMHVTELEPLEDADDGLRAAIEIIRKARARAEEKN